MRARAHARVVVSRDASCGLCRFVVRPGGVGYMVVSSVPASASRLFVCADCHDDCHAEFGGLPARVARVIVADYALFAEPVDFTGLALVVGFPDGVPGLGAAARRLAYEFSSDFPLALRLDVTDRGHVPGAVEAFLHVRPERLTPHVLYAVVEAALIVLQAGRVELVFPASVRRLVVSEVYDAYGPVVRRRVVRFRSACSSGRAGRLRVAEPLGSRVVGVFRWRRRG